MKKEIRGELSEEIEEDIDSGPEENWKWSTSEAA
jgi:hypothetical protein